jgi:hypothetical protein
MDLADKAEALLNRDVGNVVQKRGMDIDIVLSLLDEGAPETDQVRDISNVVAVLAEPEDDSFGAFGSVERHLIEGVFDRALGYAPKPGLCEVWVTHLNRPW